MPERVTVQPLEDRMFRSMKSARGFSAVEATIILSTISVLAAAAVPALGDYLQETRRARASEDVRVIARALSHVSDDLLSRAGVPGGLQTLNVVVGPGDVPIVGSGVDAVWGTPSNGTGVGSINDHLMVNGVGYPMAGSDLPVGINGWKGPYLDRPVGVDPWGHRYAVRFGHGKAATVVLSAGADGVITTVDGPAGLMPAGDDVLSVISGR
jgi:type II secretory pathway pseudopilin PulG